MPLLNSCGPFSAAVGPSLTLVNSGSILQASASYAGSSVMKKFKKDDPCQLTLSRNGNFTRDDNC